jgi:hypothetical protein
MRDSVIPMWYGSGCNPRSVVRGSSRWIMTLRVRPAYSRVINRRKCLTRRYPFYFPNKKAALSPDTEARPEKQIQRPSNPEIFRA